MDEDEGEDLSNLVVLDPVRVTPKKHGRNQVSKYTPALADEICYAVASDSRGLMEVCDSKPHWPHFTQIYRWRVQHDDFNRAFVLAQKMRAAMFMDEIVRIVDDANNDLIEVEGRMLPNPVSVQRAKLRAEFRERVAKRLDPQTWGDKVELNANVGYLPQDEVVRLLK